MRWKVIYRHVFLITILLEVSSCEELIEVDPPRSGVSSDEVFEDDITAVAAISRLYYPMSEDGFRYITYPASLSSDELMVEAGELTRIQFYNNQISSMNSWIQSTWSKGYQSIYVANAAIQGLNRSEKISADLRNQLLGEAKFFRAFNHFYMVNLFGDVPYVTNTDYRINGLLERVSIEEVYDKIISDLVDARELLSDDYAYSKNERVRVNKWAAIAMLARVYLYQEDWDRAAEQASKVIERTNLFELTKPEEVFLKNSKEAILQLIPTYPQQYTFEGQEFNRSYYDISSSVIQDELANVFESNDKRKEKWLGVGNASGHNWYYPLKYKETSTDTTEEDEYSMVLRLAEQYLIRAEAKAKQDNPTSLNDAISDVNVIRERAGLSPTTATNQQELLAAIEQERRVEFFTEWGHRWLDLKRTGRADAVLSTLKPAWDSSDALYPIPFYELKLNPKLTQNPNY